MRKSIALLTTAFLASALTHQVMADYPTFNANRSILSGMKDLSSFGGWGENNYGFNVNNNQGSDLYINAINFLPDVNYDPNIGLYDSGYYNAWGFGGWTGNFYTLGTAIPSGAYLNIDKALTLTGPVDPNVVNGIYDFSLEILGGNDALASDVLATIPYQIRIADGIQVSLTASASPATIMPGQTTTISTTIHNDDLVETFVTTTWYISSVSNGVDNLQNGQFVGNWWNQSVAAGDTLTDDHSTWDATNATSNGNYVANLGIIGGLYAGDWYLLPVSPDPLVEVVPEPASLSLLLIGSAAMLVRRRQTK